MRTVHVTLLVVRWDGPVKKQDFESEINSISVVETVQDTH